MGTQKEIAKEIVNGDGDYILSLKENQKTLHDDVELFFKEEVVIQNKTQLEEQGLYYKTLDNSHGRFKKIRFAHDFGNRNLFSMPSCKP